MGIGKKKKQGALYILLYTYLLDILCNKKQGPVNVYGIPLFL